jgi:hypothetical protein
MMCAVCRHIPEAGSTSLCLSSRFQDLIAAEAHEQIHMGVDSQFGPAAGAATWSASRALGMAARETVPP